MDEQVLQAAGCTRELARRCQVLVEQGKSDVCLQLLQHHRAELLVALHEAQRPIDICDWIISNLMKQRV